MIDPDSQKANLGAQIEIQGLSENDLKTMSDNGYKFKGWKVQEDGSILQPGTLYSSYSNKILIAEWEKVTHKLTFRSNGAIYQEIDDLIHARTYNISDLDIGTPTNYGYRFLGWYANPNGTGNEITSVTLTEDMTLYAKWERNIVTIEYYLEGTYIKSEEVAAGISYTPLTKLGIDEDNSKILLGYTISGGGTVDYESSITLEDNVNGNSKLILNAVYIDDKIVCDVSDPVNITSWKRGVGYRFYTNTNENITANISADYGSEFTCNITSSISGVNSSEKEENSYTIYSTKEGENTISASMYVKYQNVSRTMDYDFHIIVDRTPPTLKVKSAIEIQGFWFANFVYAKVSDNFGYYAPKLKLDSTYSMTAGNYENGYQYKAQTYTIEDLKGKVYVYDYAGNYAESTY